MVRCSGLRIRVGYILDGITAILFTSGRSENRFDWSCEEFLKEWKKAGEEVPPNAAICPVLTKSNPEFSIVVKNWKLCCKKDGELSIVHSDWLHEEITLKDLSKFVFKDMDGIKRTFKATSVSPELPAGWISRETEEPEV